MKNPVLVVFGFLKSPWALIGFLLNNRSYVSFEPDISAAIPDY
jgi:hypothetical protein